MTSHFDYIMVVFMHIKFLESWKKQYR